jgi:ATP-dependent protease Clp ATPase subunit
MLIGPTGTGKTLLAQTLAKLLSCRSRSSTRRR